MMSMQHVISVVCLSDYSSRLTQHTYHNSAGIQGIRSFWYDVAGNRTQIGGSFARTLLPDAVAAASYDAANRQLQFGDSSMTFDKNGNLSSTTNSSGSTAFTWDARDRLTGLLGPSMTGSFTYDVVC